jgi:hypothetical protein
MGPVGGKFCTGIALMAVGLALALGPVVSASASGSSLPVTPPAAAATSGGVVAGVTVYGRPWSGRPGG